MQLREKETATFPLIFPPPHLVLACVLKLWPKAIVTELLLDTVVTLTVGKHDGLVLHTDKSTGCAWSHNVSLCNFAFEATLRTFSTIKL